MAVPPMTAGGSLSPTSPAPKTKYRFRSTQWSKSTPSQPIHHSSMNVTGCSIIMFSQSNRHRNHPVSPSFASKTTRIHLNSMSPTILLISKCSARLSASSASRQFIHTRYGCGIGGCRGWLTFNIDKWIPLTSRSGTKSISESDLSLVTFPIVCSIIATVFFICLCKPSVILKLK